MDRLDFEDVFHDKYQKLLRLDPDARHHCTMHYEYGSIGLFDYIEELKNQIKKFKDFEGC